MGTLEKNMYLIGVINIICHLAIIPAFIYGEWWMFILSFLWGQFVFITSGTCGYHRYFAHNSFKAGKWYDIYCQVIGLFGNPGPALMFIAYHRTHHKYSDLDKDPHSPIHKGFWKVYASLWVRDYDITASFREIRNEMKHSSLRWFFDHYFKLSFLIMFIFFIIDPLLFVFGYCFPVVFAHQFYGLINAYCHRHGKSENSAWVALLTGGEGWHLNHHNDAGNYCFGKYFDLGSVFINKIKI